MTAYICGPAYVWTTVGVLGMNGSIEIGATARNILYVPSPLLFNIVLLVVVYLSEDVIYSGESSCLRPG